MKAKNWKDTAELIGIAAIVVSLIFVGMQIRQEKEIANAQLFSGWDDTQIEWARLVAENREVWVRGLENEELSNADRAAFNVIASALFDKEGSRYRTSILMGGLALETFVKKNADIIYSYPGLSAAWEEYTKFHRSHPHGAWLTGYWDATDASIEEARSGLRDHTVPPAFGPN